MCIDLSHHVSSYKCLIKVSVPLSPVSHSMWVIFLEIFHKNKTLLPKHMKPILFVGCVATFWCIIKQAVHNIRLLIHSPVASSSFYRKCAKNWFYVLITEDDEIQQQWDDKWLIDIFPSRNASPCILIVRLCCLSLSYMIINYVPLSF